ncbi:hypothetical protein [Janthinobacterium sp. HLX7-2]|uniref:hypothetical protein n=1 Tax=Janthinobacterium sp. HLX7-2 TaxID=1259331 RepID=UPI003F1F15BE
MRNDSHKKTLIAILREHVSAWRKDVGLSSYSAINVIVQAHDDIGGPSATGIRFEPHPDEYQRMKNNGDRVLRWLDDETKENNLLPANFVLSALAGLPPAERMDCLNELLHRFGLCVRSLETAEEIGLGLADVCEMASADAEALAAVAAAIAQPTQANVELALRRTARADEKKARVRRMLEGAKRAMSRTKAVIAKVLHPTRQH